MHVLVLLLVVSSLVYSFWPVSCGRAAGPGGTVQTDLPGGFRVLLALSERLEPSCERSANLGMLSLGLSTIAAGFIVGRGWKRARRRP